MPGLSGHEVLARLKKDPSMMDIPIIMLSQSTQDHDLVNSIRSGAIDYIHKPFRPEDLVGRIEGILQAAGRTVVIADNDPMIVHLLKSKFEFEGYRVVTAGDGQKALDLIAKYKPDLVLLDIIMPALDGTAVIHRMRQMPKTKDVPVLIMSTRIEKEDIEEGLSSGAQDYIPKPFSMEELYARSMALMKANQT
jgi:DNA-binding response OmpR family regulator